MTLSSITNRISGSRYRILVQVFTSTFYHGNLPFLTKVTLDASKFSIDKGEGLMLTVLLRIQNWQIPIVVH